MRSTPNPNLKVTRHPQYGWEVLVTVEGPKTDVDAFVEQYYREYHPAGYGTNIKRSIEKDGNIEVTISRARSCD